MSTKKSLTQGTCSRLITPCMKAGLVSQKMMKKMASQLKKSSISRSAVSKKMSPKKTTKRVVKKPTTNPWILHVKKVQKAKGITYAEAIKVAGSTYVSVAKKRV